MTDRPKPRRPKAAALSRIAVTGAAVAGTLGVVGALGLEAVAADESGSVDSSTVPPPAGPGAESGPEAQIIVIRRHLVPTDAPVPSAATPPPPTQTVVAPSVSAPAPVDTDTRGTG